MHYIKFLRVPTISHPQPPSNRRGTSASSRAALSICLTIATDLSDSVLYPPLHLRLFLRPGRCAKVFEVDPVTWSGKGQVLKATVELGPEAVRQLSSRRAVLAVFPRGYVLDWEGLGEAEERGDAVWLHDVARPESVVGDRETMFAVLPAWINVDVKLDSLPAAKMAPVSDALLRKLWVPNLTGGTTRLEIQEDLCDRGIKSHIWDAGLATSSFFSHLLSTTTTDLSPPLLSLREVLLDRQPNVVELGSGVGVLGLSLATLLTHAASRSESRGEQTVLLTDQAGGEEVADPNIALFRRNRPGHEALVRYADLDWEDGEKGVFPACMEGKRWELVVLSDCTYNVDAFGWLVGTLSRIHEKNVAVEGSEGEVVKTRVVLGMKRRHDSEKSLFGLLEEQEWVMVGSERMSMRRNAREMAPTGVEDGNDDFVVVEVYIFEKAG